MYSTYKHTTDTHNYCTLTNTYTHTHTHAHKKQTPLTHMIICQRLFLEVLRMYVIYLDNQCGFAQTIFASPVSRFHSVLNFPMKFPGSYASTNFIMCFLISINFAYLRKICCQQFDVSQLNPGRHASRMTAKVCIMSLSSAIGVEFLG